MDQSKSILPDWPALSRTSHSVLIPTQIAGSKGWAFVVWEFPFQAGPLGGAACRQEEPRRSSPSSYVSGHPSNVSVGNGLVSLLGPMGLVFWCFGTPYGRLPEPKEPASPGSGACTGVPELP